MNNTTVQRIVLLGAIASILVIAAQAYYLFQDYHLKSQNFNYSVNLALRNVAYELSKLTQTPLQPKDFIRQTASNMYYVDVNSKINPTNLDYYLRKHFAEGGITEDFDYSIYDCFDEKMVYVRYISNTAISANDSLKVERNFPKLDGDSHYYFGVRFPKRDSAILGNMTLSLVFTAISVLTVIFFLYAITVILRQKRLSELQKDFINNMTHEFKTPISTIKVAADVVASYPSVSSDPRMARYAQIIREQNNRLNSQVEKVLQITRIDRNTLDLNKEVINLHEILSAVVPTIQVKIEEKNGILHQNLNASQPYIKADTLHLTNILHNLLDNAMKYCKEGKPDISITTSNVGNSIRLIIADKGIGIDKEHHKKVFYRFYRVPTGDIHNVKGFGLGLFYVKNIVQAHGWQIDLESKAGEGTTIVIDMPKVLESPNVVKPKRTEEFA
jgi:two-component system, OmpR family, phosphate regulon sensor histidine kinase PhoR